MVDECMSTICMCGFVRCMYVCCVMENVLISLAGVSFWESPLHVLL